MAIAFDASATGSASSTSLTYAHTCTGSNGLLVVGVRNGSDVNFPTGVTYAGAAMHLAGQTSNGGTSYAMYFIAPPATGTNNVVISFAGSESISGFSNSYTGLKTTTTTDGVQTNTATGTTGSISVTSTADNCWGFLIVGDNGSGIVTMSNFNQRYHPSNGFVAGDTNGVIHPAGSITFNVADSSTGNMSMIAATFAPFIASTVNGNFLSFM